MYSPLLFNLYLDVAIANNNILKKLPIDDLCKIKDKKQESEATIAALK